MRFTQWVGIRSSVSRYFVLVRPWRDPSPVRGAGCDPVRGYAGDADRGHRSGRRRPRLRRGARRRAGHDGHGLREGPRSGRAHVEPPDRPRRVRPRLPGRWRAGPGCWSSPRSGSSSPTSPHGEVPVPRMSALAAGARAGPRRARRRARRAAGRDGAALRLAADDGTDLGVVRPGRGDGAGAAGRRAARRRRARTSPSGPRRSPTTRAGRRSPPGTRRWRSRPTGSTTATARGRAGGAGEREARAATPGERWTVQAGPAWSREHLEDDPDDVARTLVAALGEVPAPDRSPPPAMLTAHRWRYARVTTPLAVACLATAAGGSAPRATGASRRRRRSTPARCSREPAFRRLCTAGAPSPAHSWTDRRMRPERAIRSGHVPADHGPRPRARRHRRRSSPAARAPPRTTCGSRSRRASATSTPTSSPTARATTSWRACVTWGPTRLYDEAASRPPEKEDLRRSRGASRSPAGASRWARATSRARVSGPWGSLSIVTNPFTTDITTKSLDARLNNAGQDTGTRRRRRDDHAHAASRRTSPPEPNSLWTQGGTTTDPRPQRHVPRQYGFGALRCAIDNLNGDNVEWIGFPQGAKHVFCYAYYVKPPPTSGTIIVPQAASADTPAETASTTFPFKGNISFNADDSFALTAKPGGPGAITSTAARSPAARRRGPSARSCPTAGRSPTSRAPRRAGRARGRRTPPPRHERHARRGGHGHLHVHRPAHAAEGGAEHQQDHARRGRHFSWDVTNAGGTRVGGVAARRPSRASRPPARRTSRSTRGPTRSTEELPSSSGGDWALTRVTCNGQTVAEVQPVSVALTAGAGVFCTFTNRSRRRGRSGSASGPSAPSARRASS